MKEQIESWLTLHKIDIIKMFYSGSGDEGCIHSMYFYDKISYLYEAAPNEDGVHYFPHYYNLLEIAGESLDSFVGGWENNEGSSGWWIWDVSTGIIRIEHEVNVITTEYEEHATAWNEIG